MPGSRTELARSARKLSDTLSQRVYDDSVSAQPAEREDPLDPQRILDQLPVDERGFFLDQYRDAVENARDPAGWKQLRRVLLRWRFHADAVGDPAYREALDAARGPVGGGTLPVMPAMTSDH